MFAEQTPIAKNQPVAGIGPLKLGHLAFCVDEPKKFADFYGRVLGFRRVGLDPGLVRLHALRSRTITPSISCAASAPRCITSRSS